MYIVISSATGIKHLAGEVNEKINQGYTLVGGVCTPDNVMFYQAMYKELSMAEKAEISPKQSGY